MTGPWSSREAKTPGQNHVKVCGGSAFVDGFIIKSPCAFTIDTSADVTIMNHLIYTYLVNVEELQPPEQRRGNDGNEIPVLGKVTVPIGLDRRRSTRARIQEDCILGTDFLTEEGCAIDYLNCVL